MIVASVFRAQIRGRQLRCLLYELRSDTQFCDLPRMRTATICVAFHESNSVRWKRLKETIEFAEWRECCACRLFLWILSLIWRRPQKQIVTSSGGVEAASPGAQGADAAWDNFYTVIRALGRFAVIMAYFYLCDRCALQSQINTTVVLPPRCRQKLLRSCYSSSLKLWFWSARFQCHL